METKEAAKQRRQPIDRIAWLVTFVVPLVLSALLLTAKAAQADELPAASSAASEEVFEVEVEEVTELEPDEACFTAEEDFEEGKIDESELEGICEEKPLPAEPKPKAPEQPTASECPLRSAQAHAAIKRDRLKLTIGYTTSEPGNASFDIKRGSTPVASLHRHLGPSGVIRLTKQLGGKHTGGRLVVRIKLPSGTVGCPSRRLVLFPR